MSYEEFAKEANRYHYIHYSELMFGDRKKRTDPTDDDQIFGIPHFGTFLNTKNPPSVKGGENHKNTAN